ncbi:hypothetical protein Trydic_g23276 [Trypoxylus dichotomus]
MNIYRYFLWMSIFFVTAARSSKISVEDRQFLEDLPATQAEILGRLLYTFRKFAQKDPAIQSALAVLSKGDYQRRRLNLLKLEEFSELSSRMNLFETLAKIIYFYDPLVLMADLAIEHKDVAPSFDSFMKSREFGRIFNDLTQLTNRTALIFGESIDADSAAIHDPNISAVVSSPQYLAIVKVWNELGLNIMDQVKLVLTDYKYKVMIDKIGIKY